MKFFLQDLLDLLAKIAYAQLFVVFALVAIPFYLLGMMRTFEYIGKVFYEIKSHLNIEE